MSRAAEQAHPPLHVRGVVLGPSGFAAQGREWLALLDDLGLAPSLHGARLGGLDGGEGAAMSARIAACASRPPQTGRVTVHHVLPPGFEPDGGAVADVVLTVFETRGLPPGWAERLNRAAAVVVPAPPIAEAFVRGGVDAGRVHAIAPPVELGPYRSDVAPWRGLPPRRRGVQRMLSVFDWSARKGMDVLLPAFARACGYDDAELVLKLAPQPGLDVAAVRDLCRRVVRQHAPATPPVVHVVADLMTDEQLPGLYAACDALVLPSRGEGWGRPVHEAMAMGLPVVATQAGALATLLPSAELGYPVRADIAPVSADAALQAPVFAGQEWWEPDVRDLEEQLARCVRDPEAARAKGRRARSRIRALCDRDQIAAAFCRVLDAVSACAGSAPAPDVCA